MPRKARVLDSDISMEDSDTSFMAPPSKPPKKRKSTSTIAPSNDNNGYEADATPTKKPKLTPKGRVRKQTSKPPLKALPMATAPALAASHDKMLLEMRDAGASWEDIRKKWREMTGDNTAYSTLPNRYSRLKAAFVVIAEEDNAALIEAKHEVDAEFERGKWGMVAERMVEKGAGRYRAADLRLQYQKLIVFEGELRGEGWER